MVMKMKLDDSGKALGIVLHVMSSQETAAMRVIANNQFIEIILLAVKTDNSFSPKSFIYLGFRVKHTLAGPLSEGIM